MEKTTTNPMDIPGYREASEKISEALNGVSGARLKLSLLGGIACAVALQHSDGDMDKAEGLIKKAAEAMLGAVYHAKKLSEVLHKIKAQKDEANT